MPIHKSDWIDAVSVENALDAKAVSEFEQAFSYEPALARSYPLLPDRRWDAFWRQKPIHIRR